MLTPSFADNVRILKRLFGLWQESMGASKKNGHPFIFEHIDMIIFFVIMTLRRIHRFKSMQRWLQEHPEIAGMFLWKKIPHRTTLSRRYKALYPVVQDFIRFLGKWAEYLGGEFRRTELFEDKSLFKARGPVWHREWRKRDEVPKGLRNLDKDASWSYSEHHGWVYGYGIHLTVTVSGFPADVIVETASVSESEVIDRKAGFIKDTEPRSVTADNSYCNLSRIREWAESGVALITPGKKLGKKSLNRQVINSLSKNPKISSFSDSEKPLPNLPLI